MTDKKAIKLLAEIVRSSRHHYDGDEFRVVVDDPNKETWSVEHKHYVDADRGGYCGCVHREVIDDLSQPEATALAKILNG